MKRIALGLIVVAAVLSAFVPAKADADGHVNFFLGQKSLDSDDWAPIDDQFEFGAVMSFGQDAWPVHIAVDVLASVGQEDLGGGTFTGSTFEVDAGVRKIWKKGKTLPYVGAGVSVVGAAAKLETPFGDTDGDGSGFGFWAGGGVFWRLGERFNIGLDVRYSDAKVDLDFGSGVVARDVNAGGLQYGLLLGFGW